MTQSQLPHPLDYPWIPDAGDGTYRNPIIHADYSDPDVIRVGEDFYMVTSSFNCTPGLPILHSRDLVNWHLINHAIRQVPHPRYSAVQPGCGVWAPAIRHQSGKFWIFFPLPDEGIYVTTATDPEGEWSEPWLLQEAKGWIDPCPFWDDDGQAYLAHAYAISRAGIKERIHIRPMSPDGKRLLGHGSEVVHTPHHPYLEGPKIHKMNGWYYILAPGGGVPEGWQIVFRSRNIFGPYEEKVVLEQGSTKINGPHQGALVDLPNGEWWFIHFQDTGPFGRIVHLQPVTWQNDWPLMGKDLDGNGIGEPVASWCKPGIGKEESPANPETSDEFTSSRIGLQWQWHANHDPKWASLTERPGWLRLFSQKHSDTNLSLAPHFLGQKFPARKFSVETLLDFGQGQPGEIAGLAVLGGSGYAAIALRRTDTRQELVFLIAGDVILERTTPTPIVRLCVIISPDATCTFAAAGASGEFYPTEHTFRAGKGGWIGAKIGLFSIASPGSLNYGKADFDYFRLSSPASRKSGKCLESDHPAYPIA